MQRVRELHGLDPDAMPFDFPEAAAAEPGIRRIYRLLGADDRFVVRQPDCDHDFPPEVREEAYAFLDRVLSERDRGADR